MAVAITLLVLNLTVPPPPDPHLAHSLLKHWPDYLAYVVSFVTIGIVWINHHSMVSRLERGDHVILVINLLLLLTIGLLPFATNLMASYLTQSSGERLAAGVYSGAFLLMGLAFSLLNWNIFIRRPQLLAQPMGDVERRTVFRRAASGVIPYVIATAIAPLSAYASLAICAAVAVFYALPLASGR